MKLESVLISGAGIAGPALAGWLTRLGARVTVVERASSVRAGGQAVDFRGEAHLSIVHRMGILEELRNHQTNMGRQSFIDSRGRIVASLPASFMSGDIEIPRGDLSRILHARTKGEVEYVFGDSISAIANEPDRVVVSFESGASRSFDLVVGADGLHSLVRALVFGEEARFVRFMGYQVAGITLPNLLDLDREGVIFSEAGRGVSVTHAGGALARATFVFRSSHATADRRDVALQKSVVAEAFEGSGWRVPALLGALAEADDLYFDSIACVDLPRLSSGRVVLLGDAGYGGTLGGQGTGLAMVGAYILAGELAAADDHVTAFRRYEERIRPYATSCQAGVKHVGPFYAPATVTHRWMRDRMYGVLASRPFERILRALTTRAATGIALEAYAM